MKTIVDRESPRRVRFSAAMSLDGYIAGPNGETDWIVMDPDLDFTALMGSFDAVLMGRKTYETVRGQAGAAGLPGMKTYVFSSTLSQRDCPGVIVSNDPAGTVAGIKESPGKDIWLFGGGLLFSSLLRLGLVDAVEVTVVPRLLGGGLPLLPLAAVQPRLKLTGHRVYPKTGLVSLEYGVAR
ncbi:MAG: dihydrofolate reductase [Acidobacteria bacterium]|nr:dihydrofolate reductase [Acidobacteriota bacterium]